MGTGGTRPFVDGIERTALRKVAQVRVLYADTDKMGIVYHASYLRYLELGRVELIRQSGMPYAQMERLGLALPLTDLAVRYRSPARYDDRMSIYIGLSKLTPVRVHFDYRIVVHGPDRAGVDAASDGPLSDVEILTAQTRHACVRLRDGRPERLPGPVYEVLGSCYKQPSEE